MACRGACAMILTNFGALLLSCFLLLILQELSRARNQMTLSSSSYQLDLSSPPASVCADLFCFEISDHSSTFCSYIILVLGIRPYCTARVNILKTDSKTRTCQALHSIDHICSRSRVLALSRAWMGEYVVRLGKVCK